MRPSLLGGAAALLAAVTAAAVPIPTVTGPIPATPASSPFLASTSFDVSPFGYVEEEFFLSGTASAYVNVGPLAADGKWAAAPGDTAAYTTRILVRRPAARKRFNGTVLVEWLNVSGGVDAAPDWTFLHAMLMREGFAWVGVSAQFVGVSGGSSPLGLNLALKAVNPVRYGPLLHPGDSFSYDMFSQVATALRYSPGPAPLGDLVPKRVIAIGESQSAFRLVTYVNAIHPLVNLYDGFLVHSRGGGGAPLSQAPEPSIGTPNPAPIRDDLVTPVLTFQTETDLVTLGFFPARQPDGPTFRLWEVAGTAHADVYQAIVGATDQGTAAVDTTHLPPTSVIYAGVISCNSPVNQGPQQHVLGAAFGQLVRWVRTGRPPRRSAPRLEVVAGSPPTILRDALGNALGGIRTPAVDVPVSVLSGLGQTGSNFCVLFGTTTPLDAPTLASLYPDHARYVTAVARSAKAAVRAGFLTKPDAKMVRAAADASNVGN